MVVSWFVVACSLAAQIWAGPIDVEVGISSEEVGRHHIGKRSVAIYGDIFLQDSCPGPSNLDGDQINDILAYHNDKRRIPWSSNMNYITWDDQLACQAQRVADSCRWGHNGLTQSPQANTFAIGQNIIAVKERQTFFKMERDDLYWYMDYFYDEIEHYIYPNGFCENTGECNHYRMMMMAKQTKMGAACTFCMDWKKNKTAEFYDYSNTDFYVNFCVFNYEFPLSAINGQELYEEGAPCSSCEMDWGKCIEGLCEVCEPGESGCQSFDNCADVYVNSTCTYCKSNGLCRLNSIKTNCAKTCGAC